MATSYRYLIRKKGGWDITKILYPKDEQCQVKSFSNRC
jgi:hypothetical protein